MAENEKTEMLNKLKKKKKLAQLVEDNYLNELRSDENI
jgi:hypothetical protein